MTDHPARLALITGASRGLGLALATALARAGWSLILDARAPEPLVAVREALSSLTTVYALPGDVADPAHRRALAALAGRLGGLDAVVNNASSLGPSPLPSLLSYPLAALEAVYRTNVLAPLALLQDLAASLKPDVRIVNISSDAAVAAYPGWGGTSSPSPVRTSRTARFPSRACRACSPCSKGTCRAAATRLVRSGPPQPDLGRCS